MFFCLFFFESCPSAHLISPPSPSPSSSSSPSFVRVLFRWFFGEKKNLLLRPRASRRSFVRPSVTSRDPHSIYCLVSPFFLFSLLSLLSLLAISAQIIFFSFFSFFSPGERETISFYANLSSFTVSVRPSSSVACFPSIAALAASTVVKRTVP